MKGKLQPLHACRRLGYFPALCFTWGSSGTFLTPPPPTWQISHSVLPKICFCISPLSAAASLPLFFFPPPVGLRSEPKLRVQGPPFMQPLTLY